MDSFRFTKRRIFNIQSEEGDQILIDKDDNSSMIDYFVSVSQEQYDSEDPANPCANYPTEEFSSYADCDDQFVKRSLPPGLKPFWAVDDISEADDTISIDNDVWEHMDFGKVLFEVSLIILFSRRPL